MFTNCPSRHLYNCTSTCLGFAHISRIVSCVGTCVQVSCIFYFLGKNSSIDVVIIIPRVNLSRSKRTRCFQSTKIWNHEDLKCVSDSFTYLHLISAFPYRKNEFLMWQKALLERMKTYALVVVQVRFFNHLKTDDYSYNIHTTSCSWSRKTTSNEGTNFLENPTTCKMIWLAYSNHQLDNSVLSVMRGLISIYLFSHKVWYYCGVFDIDFDIFCLALRMEQEQSLLTSSSS